jgi:hypothetical protein
MLCQHGSREGVPKWVAPFFKAPLRTRKGTGLAAQIAVHGTGSDCSSCGLPLRITPPVYLERGRTASVPAVCFHPRRQSRSTQPALDLCRLLPAAGQGTVQPGSSVHGPPAKATHDRREWRVRPRRTESRRHICVRVIASGIPFPFQPACEKAARPASGAQAH